MARDDDLDQIRQQLGEVERSSSTLRESVLALQQPLDVLAEIQQEQREIRRAADQAGQDAAAAARIATARDVRTRIVVRRGGVIAVCVLLAVTALTFVALIGFVRQLIDQEQRSRYPACMTRNAGTSAQIRREATLAGLPSLSLPERKIHAQSAVELRKGLADCSHYLEDR